MPLPRQADQHHRGTGVTDNRSFSRKFSYLLSRTPLALNGTPSRKTSNHEVRKCCFFYKHCAEAHSSVYISQVEQQDPVLCRSVATQTQASHLLMYQEAVSQQPFHMVPDERCLFPFSPDRKAILSRPPLLSDPRTLPRGSSICCPCYAGLNPSSMAQRDGFHQQQANRRFNKHKLQASASGALCLSLALPVSTCVPVDYPFPLVS
jgi:hypothetical protein